MADLITPKYSLLKVKKEDSFNTFTQNYNNILLEELDKDFASKLGKDDIIEAGSLKFKYMIDLDTMEVSDEINNYSGSGFYQFFDADKLRKLLEDREANAEKINLIVKALTNQLMMINAIPYPEGVETTLDIDYFINNFSATLFNTATPFLYQQCTPLDNGKIEVYHFYFINNIVRFYEHFYAFKMNENDNYWLQGDLTIDMNKNRTFRENVIYIVLRNFLNDSTYKLDEAVKERLYKAFKFIFLFNDGNTTSANYSIISKGAYNAHGDFTNAIPFLGRLLRDIVSIDVDADASWGDNKDSVASTLESGTPIPIDKVREVSINSNYNEDIKKVEQLDNYFVLLKIKLASGDYLPYLLAVVDGGFIGLVQRLDNYDPYMFGLESTFLPSVMGTIIPTGIQNSYSGYIDWVNSPSITIGVPEGVLPQDFMSNTIFMSKETPSEQDNRLLLGINNVVYPNKNLEADIEANDTIHLLSYNKTKDTLGHASISSIGKKIAPPFTNQVITKPDATIDELDMLVGFTSTGDSIALPKADIIAGGDLPTDLTKDGYNYKNAYNSSIIPSLGLIGKNTVDLVQKFGDGTQITIYNVISTQISDVPLSTCHLTVNKVDSNLVKSYVIAESGLSNDMSQFICKFTGTADAGFTGVWTRLRNADGSVPINIPDKSITNTKIADATITGAKIANDTITATQIAANAITSAELANNAVVEAKIASNAITTAKIKDASVTDAKLSGVISNAHGGLGGALTASDGRRLAYVNTTGSNTPEKAATYTGRYRTTTWVDYPTNASNGAQGELYNYNWNEGNASTANGWGYQEFITPIGEVWYRVRNNGKYTAKTGWQKIRASNGAATLVDVNAVIAAIKANPGAVRAALGLGSLSTLNSINLSDTTKTTGILPSSRGGFDYQNYLG